MGSRGKLELVIDSSLDGQVAFITCASRGIGQHLASRLADTGAEVVGIARSSGTSTSERVTFETADVSDSGQIRSAFDRAIDQLGAPDLVVAFAGVADALGPIQSVDVDDWWRAVEIDLRGTMLTIREALRAMVPAGAGRVVTVYGNLGDRQGKNVSAFASAKAGIARLTEIAAVETAGTGVVVLGVHPGFVRTPMTESLAWGEAGATWLPSFGEGVENRWSGPEAAADLVLRVASGEADDLSGRSLRVDDDIPTLIDQSNENSDYRRLRLDLSSCINQPPGRSCTLTAAARITLNKGRLSRPRVSPSAIAAR